MKDDTIFDSLVKNAIDFMKHSVKEIEKEPKYSVIHFCSSVELFFKARLLLEHWTLIFAKPDQAKRKNFLSGDFMSVGIKELVGRLENITNEPFQREEKKCLDQIQEHRNKLVHFFNQKYSEKPSDVISEVVSEQCKAWFYLHRLLTTRWKNEFRRYMGNIENLNNIMHGIRMFLKAKYCAILPELEEHEKQGHGIVRCFACSYESAILKDEMEPLFLQECLVCRTAENVLKFPCTECSSDIVVNDPHAAFCRECDHEVSIADLIEKYGDDTGTKEYHTTPTHAHCCECEYFPESVVPLGDEWICLSCLIVHCTIEACNYCGLMSTGDLSESYLGGCSRCDGKFGSDSFLRE